VQSIDCRKCGACCSGLMDYGYFVDLEEGDVLRLPKHYRKKHVLQVNNSSDWMALATKVRPSGMVVCVAFRGRPGKKCWCSIYDMRPRACRDFKPGSLACRELVKLQERK